MEKNKSQISIEYMILTGFILAVIIIPSVFFLYSFANRGVHGTVQRQKTMDLGNGLVENAKQMYYLGLYSKKNVQYDVPLNVRNMFIVEIDEDDDGVDLYYYFGIFTHDGKVLVKSYFQSDVPLMSDDDNDYIAYDDNDHPELIFECGEMTTDCSYYFFIDPIIREGKKTFKLETVMEGTNVKVAIVPIVE